MRKFVLPLLAAVLTVTGVGLAQPALAGYGSSILSNKDFDNVATGRTDLPRCAAMTSNTFTGTITGADGLYPDVTIGFDVKDAAGRSVDIADGCHRYGYGAIVQLNHFIGAEGAPAGTMQYNKASKYIPTKAQGLVTNSFTLKNLPANARTIWIETYTRRYTGSPCGLGCAGKLDNSKYGQINRRALKIQNGHVDMVLPLTPAYGGTTGSIKVHVVNKQGQPVDLGRLYSWSTVKDGSVANQGWGIGRPIGNGYYLVPALGANQKYVMWFYAKNDKVLLRKKGVQVRPNYTTALTVHV